MPAALRPLAARHPEAARLTPGGNAKWVSVPFLSFRSPFFLMVKYTQHGYDHFDRLDSSVGSRRLRHRHRHPPERNRPR